MILYYEGGANGESLRVAQYNFLTETKNKDYSEEYEKEKEWKIHSPPDERSGLKNVKTNFVGDKNGILFKK